MRSPAPPSHRLWLLAILAGHLILSLWASFSVPLGEAPDELSHYDYFKDILAYGRPPQGRESYESFQPPLYYLLAAGLTFWVDAPTGFGWVRANPDFDPRRSDSPPNALIHTRFERFPWRDSALAMHLGRVWSAFLTTAALWFVYRMGLAWLPQRPEIALWSAGLLGFTPQYAFLGGMVNNDALAALVGAAFLWAALSLVRHALEGSARRRDVGWLGVILGTGLLTKTSFLAFAPIAALALAAAPITSGVAARRQGMSGVWRQAAGRWLRDSALAFALALLLAAPLWLYNTAVYGDPLAWTALRGLVDLRTEPLTWGSLAQWLQGLWLSWWGKFGAAAHIALPPAVYAILTAASVLAFAGCLRLASRLARGQEGDAASRWGGLLLVLATGAIFVSLFRYSLIAQGTDQGRLLYPVAGPLALALGGGCAELIGSRRCRSARWTGAFLGALAIFAAWAICLYLPAHYRPPAPPDASALQRAQPAQLAFAEPGAVATLTNAGAALTAADASIALEGWQVDPAEWQVGQPLTVTLYWRALRPIPFDGRGSLWATGPGEASWEWKWAPARGLAPTDRWQPGDLIADRRTIRLPTTAPFGRYSFALGIFRFEDGAWLSPRPGAPDAAPRAPLFALDYRPRERTALPADARPLDVRVGEFTLVGYRIAAAPDAVWVTLYWRAEEPSAEDYTVFVHLVAPDGSIVAQHDGPPAGGLAPTSAWRLGTIIEDPHGIALAQPLPRGWQARVGMYIPSAGRLPAFDREGVRLPDDQVVLP
jgi:hypothetical protein